MVISSFLKGNNRRPILTIHYTNALLSYASAIDDNYSLTTGHVIWQLKESNLKVILLSYFLF